LFDCHSEIEQIVCEYLSYRGFVRTYATLQIEKNEDLSHEMKASQVVRELMHHIWTGSYQMAQKIWDYLDNHFPSRFHESLSSFRTLLDGEWKKYFLVTASRNQMSSVITQFYEENNHLVNSPDWSMWFSLQYVPSPHTHPYFAMYYSREWEEQFLSSLFNYVDGVLNQTYHTRAPLLMALVVERKRRVWGSGELLRLKRENENLKTIIAQLKKKDELNEEGQIQTVKKINVQKLYQHEVCFSFLSF
jgi:hypothetical protein